VLDSVHDLDNSSSSAKVNWKPGNVSTISHERTFQKQKEQFIKREKVYNK